MLYANIFLDYFLLITLCFLSIYLIIPEILLHFLGIGSWKRQYSPGVSVTFDDGPDPNYTPLLLEILSQQHIQACFFLVGEKAQKYPDIVKKIHNEGHFIGSHGYFHQHAWLMSPQKTWKNWDKSIKVIQNIIGIEPDYIRPPWGSVNLSLYSWCIANKKKIVGWNAEGKDWRKNRSASKIIDTILQQTSEGTIILLHDSGGEQGAPANTLSCLEELFIKIREVQKLPIVALKFPNWSIQRRIGFRIWEKWEHFYARINKIKRIDDKNLFRLSLSRYRGPDLFNDKGDLLVTKGDKIGEIHFDNIRFQLMGSSLPSVGIRSLKQVRLSLPTLARHIDIHPDFKNVKAYIGITMLNKGAKGLGFNVQDYPYQDGFLIASFQKILMRIYHPAGNKRKTARLGNKPKLVWISREKLIEKYKSKEETIS
jgi:peptidoglycan/xylan/chitin deacetylase (PgdA/CDA1 family)